MYTGAQYGYMSSEFLHPVGYGAPYGGIVAAAGHHINDGRWLRTQQYGRDLVNYTVVGYLYKCLVEIVFLPITYLVIRKIKKHEPSYGAR